MIVVTVYLQSWLQIEASKIYYIKHLMDEIHPYINVENKAYITKINMGLSVRDELKTFSLAQIEYQDDLVVIKAPIGLWDYIKDLPSLKDSNIVVNTPTSYPNQYDINYKTRLMIGDYSYQKNAVVEMLKYNNGILEARPGSGKTIMGITLAALKGKSVLWINDRIELAKQAYNTAIDILEIDKDKCGLLQGDREYVKDFTFTTIQKLTKVINRGFNDPLQSLRHWDVIVIDECHHAIGSYNNYNTYFQVLNEISHHYVYGLTATVQRVDGNEHLVHAILGPVRYMEESKTKTIPAEIISKTIKIDTKEEVYESMVNLYTGKAMPHMLDEWLLFNEVYIEEVKKYIFDAIDNYNKVLIVSPRVAGAQQISDILTEVDIDHFLVYGAIKKRERLYTAKVLVATLDLIKEGFDVVDLECIVVLSRTMHKQIKTQVIGRCERYHPDKKQPRVYFLTPKMHRFERPAPSKWKELDVNEFFK